MSDVFHAIRRAALAGALALMATTALAQEQVTVRFPPGSSGTTINGTIIGQEYIDYVLDVGAGQTMIATLRVTGTNGHGSAFFNVLPAGKDYDGLYVGSMDDDSTAEVTFPTAGKWAIRVYLMGNDKDADKTVGYAIDMRIPPGKSGASGQAPAAPVVRVAGVPANDLLNVRSGPGTEHGVIGALANGDQVKRLGCETHGGSEWCMIEMMTDMHERGWVNRRYLQ